ncbi:MAG: undecaprenyl-phosphate glucose phosphotransferase [Flavobacterium sp.]|nr:MAG: undecaprenyl-phosphate glucose phosphotransferase [Flavobacterium sp.]
MMFKRGRYSGLIRPISYGIDLFIILFFANDFFQENINYVNFIVFITISWFIISFFSNFYEIYRFTKLVKILSLIVKQSVLFTVLLFSFFGFFKELNRANIDISVYVLSVFGLISIFKLATYFLLKKYRTLLGGNYRSVIILGLNKKTEQLRKFFTDNPEYGYQLQKAFDIKTSSLEDIFSFININEIDEIYCSIAELSDNQMQKIIEFSDNNLKILKFIPDNKEIYTKNLEYNYYGYLPILSLRKIPIDNPLNKFIKRLFDVALSLFVIIGILSWLTPIIAFFIKIESKGPVFFKQKRNGLDYKEFYCYKYRSMRPNPEAHLYQIRKNDPRVTKIGKIIRKTSIDELPQFVNVLKGEMSVVGPRPHMVSHTHMYAEKIDKFMVRHFVKPGITGLAQVSGFRGEVEDDNFITNRVKYDIFYLENWSLLLDFKIVFKTVFNAFGGDDKAY